jgi:hypothetical protein
MDVCDSLDAMAFVDEYAALCLKHGMKVGSVITPLLDAQGRWIACATLATREEIAMQVGEMSAGALYCATSPFECEPDEDPFA